jgi:osmotically inducible protein OsmC
LKRRRIKAWRRTQCAGDLFGKISSFFFASDTALTIEMGYRWEGTISAAMKEKTDMDRSASAVWHGSLKEGHGTISTQSTTLKDTQYSFAARFADGVGTNPEELIAAAHAGCFTMALSGQLTAAGFVPDSLETSAVLTLDMHDKPTVTQIHLTTKAKVPNIDKTKFDELAHNAEVGCPISRLLAPGTKISVDATLV